jgi:hypothetical protein
MPYRETSTACVVRLVALRGLSPATLALCQALRAEAGGCGPISSISTPALGRRSSG